MSTVCVLFGLLPLPLLNHSSFVCSLSTSLTHYYTIYNIYTHTHTNTQSHGVIFVVDSTAPERLEEARQVLLGVLKEETVAGKPLLVIANKQEQSGALSPEEVQEKLGLGCPLPTHIRVVRFYHQQHHIVLFLFMCAANVYK